MKFKIDKDKGKSKSTMLSPMLKLPFIIYKPAKNPIIENEEISIGNSIIRSKKRRSNFRKNSIDINNIYVFLVKNYVIYK